MKIKGFSSHFFSFTIQPLICFFLLVPMANCASTIIDSSLSENAVRKSNHCKTYRIIVSGIGRAYSVDVIA